MSRAGTHRRNRLDLWYCDRLDRARSRQHSAYLLFVPDRAELVRCGLQRCWVRQQPMALPTLRGEIRQAILERVAY
jgi:hypothetical protein